MPGLSPAKPATMKKALFLLLTLCIVSLYAVSAHAQSIYGTWITDGKELPGFAAADFQKADYIFTFNSNGNIAITTDVIMAQSEDGIDMTLGMKTDMRGTYKKTGDTISLSIDDKLTKLNLCQFDLNLSPDMEKALAAMGVTKQQLKTALQKEFNSQEMTKMFSGANLGGLTIVSVTSSTLVLTDEGGTTMTFTRKQ